MKNKVLFITASLGRGGAETQLIKVALFLKSMQYTVKIISLTPINEFEIDYEKEGIPVIFLRSWKGNFCSNLRALYAITKNYKPDVVIAFMFIAIIFARLLKILFKFKLISSIRIATLPRKWYIPFKITNGLDDEIVYNSVASKIDFEKKRLVSIRGKVIHNSISIPKKEDILNVKSIDFVWICVAHFRWNKDYKTLFRAIAKLKELNFRVDIIGGLNEKYLSWAELMIKDLEIESHVRILGFKSNTQTYLHRSDAFVLSSFSEGMPNALLEAMANEKPVVVTDIRCNRLILESAKCGFLSEKENPEDLAGKMKTVMELSTKERLILGQKGRTYIEENFSEDLIMQHWLSAVKSLATA